MSSKTLSSLRVIPSTPRHYEDTKPALNQAFTHAAIIDIGQKVSERCDETNEKERQLLLQEREEEVWKKAEIYKDECVKEALREASGKEEKKVKKMLIEQEKHLQKEISRVEGIMQHRGVEKVYEERAACEKKLNEVVAKLHTNFNVEKVASEQITREEEKAIAALEKEALERKHQFFMEKQRQLDDEKWMLKMEELRSQMNEERDQAIAQTVVEQTKVADERVKRAELYYEKIIKELHRRLEEKENRQKSTEIALDIMEKKKNWYVLKLKETRQSFVTFVEECRPDFSGGQSDFLLPPSITIEDDE